MPGVRVVAGEARGRRLLAPEGRDTRPTSDKVRQALFNALGSLDAIDGARVVDLFAGSGALGIEALSRGAGHVTFVEHGRAALRTIRANLDALGMADRSTVVPADVERWLDGLPPSTRFDLALADPPYAFDAWPALLGRLPADLVVAESDREVDPPPGWATLRSRRHGGTVVTFIRRTPGAAGAPDEAS